MWYKKVEEYTFTVPQEYKDYLDFKDELKAAGIKFTETGGATLQTIQVRTTGRFHKDESGKIQLGER